MITKNVVRIYGKITSPGENCPQDIIQIKQEV